MISFFNRIGNTWIARAIFAALGISMLAFWGIGGIGNTARPDQTAIQIGNKKISMMELAQEFDTERAKFSQLVGQYLSPKQAMEMGLLQQAVQKKVSDALSQAIQEELGLYASDAAVRKYVERHPAFKDALGNFDRSLFMAYLNQNRLTEPQLAEQLRSELANQHLSNTIRFVAPAPKVLAELYWAKQNELRDVEALLIETDKIKLNTNPTEEDLKDYYEAYASDFMTPETRDIAVLVLSPEKLAASIQIAQDQLDELYAEQKDSYALPEKRHVYQIRFTTKEDAEAIKSSLTTQNFVAKATENGQKENETDFGIVTRAELLTEIADAAFSANQPSIIGPVESPVGWHMIMVSQIQPAVQPSKAAIYADIKQKLAAKEAYDKLNEVTRSVEDLLGEGKSLADAAKTLNLSTQSFRNVDITGQNLPEAQKNQELLKELFTLKEGEATSLIENGNAYIIAEVSKIHPLQARPLAEVSSELRNLWRTEKQKEALADLSQEALTQIKKGTIPAKLGQVIVAKKVSLATGAEDIPQAALPALFMQSLGYENAIATPLENGMLISVVKKVKKPIMNSSDLPDQTEQLAAAISTNLYNSLIAAYADKLKISVHTDLIQKAFAQYQTE